LNLFSLHSLSDFCVEVLSIRAVMSSPMTVRTKPCDLLRVVRAAVGESAVAKVCRITWGWIFFWIRAFFATALIRESMALLLSMGVQKSFRSDTTFPMFQQQRGGCLSSFPARHYWVERTILNLTISRDSLHSKRIFKHFSIQHPSGFLLPP
jgi:hypothetical protein